MVSGRLPHAPSRPPPRGPFSRCLEPGPWPAQGAPLPPSAPTRSQDTVLTLQDPLSPILRSAAGCAPRHAPGLPRTRPLSSAWSPVPGTGASGLSHECPLRSPSWLCPWLQLCAPSSVRRGRGGTRHPGAAAGGELPRVRAETGLACGVAWSVGYPCVSLPRHALCACLQAGDRGSLGTSLCSGLFHVHTAGKGLRGTLEETS